MKGIERIYNVFTMCSGLGGGAKGFQDAISHVGNRTARWRCIGGIDNDPAACRDFLSLVGVPCSLMDLFTREQYTAFNGFEPPAGWTEVTPADVRRAAGHEHPHCVFISSPCKGASGLLSETLSRTPKYQALNELTLRCVWLMCEAWKENPVELIVFENVPRVAIRAKHLLEQIDQTLRHYGYSVNATIHDCGEIGELAQSRKRYLKVARHAEKVPAFLYEPPLKRLQGVGTVLGRMPLPGDLRAGPMHRVPSLQFKTWVRLACIEAGSDWRSLNKLAVENGHLRDYLIVPEMHNGVLGVNRWDEPCGVVAGASRPGNGSFSIADPRGPADALQYQNYGVIRWGDPSGAIIGVKAPGQGRFSVADPRHHGTPKHSNEFRIVPWEEAAGTVTGAHGTGQCVQDPRPPAGPLFSKYKVTQWDSNTGTVIGGDDQGAYAVADPRSTVENVFNSGRARPKADRQHLPSATEKMVAVIRSIDGTWHRPFTTLELAALQSLVDPEQLQIDAEEGEWQHKRTVASGKVAVFKLSGESDQAWRERIGNAVPPKAAKAVGEVMGTTLLLAESGETFQLSSTSVWARSIALALTLPSSV